MCHVTSAVYVLMFYSVTEYKDFTCTLMYTCTCIMYQCTFMSYLISIQPLWQPYVGANGGMLEVSLSYSRVLWPWSGWLAITLGVAKEGAVFTGEAAGQISLTISTPTVSYMHIIRFLY